MGRPFQKERMMKRIHLISISLFLMSCAIFIPGYSDFSSGKKYFSYGNYDKATYHLYRSLSIKPNNDKALKLFELTYDLAVEKQVEKISELSLKDDKSKWPIMVEEYKSLIKLGSYVNKLEPILKKVVNYDLNLKVNNYSSELSNANERSADYHYQLGLKFQDEPEKESQKQAAINFRLSQNYIPKYMNSQELYDKARENAIFTLVIQEFGGNKKYASYIRDQVILNQSKISKEFLKVINRDQLKTILSELALVQSGITENDYLELRRLSGADHILSASIITSHSPIEKISDKNIAQKKKVVIRTETYVDSSGESKKRNIKGTVKATVDHYKKRSNATITLTYKIVNMSDSVVLFSGEVKGRKDYFHEWATFKGDKRALSSQYKYLVTRKEQFAPSKDDLLMIIAKNVTTKLGKKISKHYSD